MTVILQVTRQIIPNSGAAADNALLIDIDVPLYEQLQSDKSKLALGGKVVHVSMGTKYKSAGAQPAMVSCRLQ